MSEADVKSFTARDFNRKTATVLETCDEFGSVEIRTRNGKRYAISALPAESARPKTLPDFDEFPRRMKGLGCVPPTVEEQERINRIIAGEE